MHRSARILSLTLIAASLAAAPALAADKDTKKDDSHAHATKPKLNMTAWPAKKQDNGSLLGPLPKAGQGDRSNDGSQTSQPQ